MLNAQPASLSCYDTRILLGIDKMNNINSLYGRKVGDDILDCLQERIRMAIPGAIVKHIGSDKFLINLSQLDPLLQLPATASRILEFIELPINLGNRSVTLTATAGISLIGLDAQSEDASLINAELAMKTAKTEGGGVWKLYSEDLRQGLDRKALLLSELRGALDGNQFGVVFQPIIDGTGGIRSVETLIRWHNPLLGHVSPVEFIPIAEETHLISDIGLWVMQEAAAVAERLAPQGISVAVNVSGQQLLDKNFGYTLESVLARTSPGMLELEVTETSLIQDPELASENLKLASFMGVKSAIDDFGTGHSNLAYLHKFAVSKIKLDRAFVKNILTQRESRAICKAVATLGHDLDMQIVGEGVETSEQAQALLSYGCDTFQGYLFEKPISEEKLSTCLSNNYYDRIAGL